MLINKFVFSPTSTPALASSDPTRDSIVHQFQNIIYDSSVEANKLALLLEAEPSLVNQYLPCGELPLHLAVRETHTNRENQIAKVEILLRKGADFELKDTQGLNALDHAAFLKDTDLLIKILSVKIGIDMSETKEQMEIIGDKDNLQDILEQKNEMTTTNFAEQAPASLAAFNGDLSKVTLKEMIECPPNNRGERPLHFAIKGRQAELVKLILEEMKKNTTDLNVLDFARNSLVHYAIAANSPDILAFLIQAGISVNQKNTRGETPLHYAAASGKINMMMDLVHHGANIKIVDSGGRLPINLFLLASKGKDPLALDESRLILSAITALYWLVQSANQAGCKIPYSSIILPSLFAASTSIELQHLLGNLKSIKKQLAAVSVYFCLGFLPPLNLAYHLLRTKYLAQESFSTIKAIGKNWRYRKWDALCKLGVTGVNTVSAVQSVYKSFLSNKYLYDLYHSDYFSDLMDKIWVMKDKLFALDPSINEEIFSLLEQIFGYRFHDQSSRKFYDQNQCSHLEGSKYAGFSNLERLTKKELNPKCAKHAAIILSPTFDQKGFCNQVKEQVNDGVYNPERLYILKKAYLKLSREAHPDKLKLNEAAMKICDYKNQPGACFIKLTTAKETLEAELNYQIYCN